MQGDYWAGVSCGGRARGKRTVAVRGLEFAGPNRGSGTLAASALARHCEATGVSLPRKGRAEADLSDVTNGTCGTNGTVNEPQLHLPHIAIAALLKPRNQKLRNFLDPSTGGFLLYYSRSADGGALAQRGEIQCTENRFSINANKSFLWKYDQSFQRLNDM